MFLDMTATNGCHNVPVFTCGMHVVYHENLSKYWNWGYEIVWSNHMGLIVVCVLMSEITTLWRMSSYIM